MNGFDLTGISRSKAAVLAAGFLILFLLAFLAGQRGIPVEDGGEFLTVARLGGISHPPGLPLLSLLSRLSWILFSASGLRIFFAIMAAASLLLCSERMTLPAMIFLLGVLLMSSTGERLLLWDAYGPLFLIYAVTWFRKPCVNLEAGYLMGLALALHPLGILLPVVFSWKDFSPLRFFAGLTLGCSLYLALPLYSASGTVVDWGNTGSIPNFLRHVTAGGYREVYGGSMGRVSMDTVIRHLRVLRNILWPVLLVPAAIGAFTIFRVKKILLLRLGILLAADALFVIIVNPMAAGTSQTGIISLFVLLILSISGISFVTAFRKQVGLALAIAVLAAGILSWQPLTDQSDEVTGIFSEAPLESVFFLSDNDLLYGGWVLKYVRDARPDIVLLSTGNFAGWFERMATWYNPDVDLSSNVLDVGDFSMSREELARRLIDATIRDNPHRPFFID